MTAQIHVGDVGTELVVRVLDEAGRPVDVSAATVLTIKLKPPSGSTVPLTAVPDTTGADGRIKYVSLAGTFALAGAYAVEGYVEVGGAKFHTEAGTFTVADHL